jgi:hypothetical protein
MILQASIKPIRTTIQSTSSIISRDGSRVSSNFGKKLKKNSNQQNGK